MICLRADSLICGFDDSPVDAKEEDVLFNEGRWDNFLQRKADSRICLRADSMICLRADSMIRGFDDLPVDAKEEDVLFNEEQFSAKESVFAHKLKSGFDDSMIR
ncbi:hypothetical protein [Flavobacterium sp. JP2137]|uniref:hypothetical protein n=1 Tax=Flavobacterium sp. JP2137 TaxID=3414510 RepID=UPI003D2FB615